MSRKKYVASHLLGSGIGLLFYMLCPGLFREIGKAGQLLSFSTLLFMVLLGGIVGVGFTVRNQKDRSAAGVFRNTVFPLGLYTVLSYYGEQKGAVLAMAVIITILTLLYMAEHMQQRKNEGLKTSMEEVPTAVGVWTLVNLGLVALMGAFAYEGVFEWLRQLTR